jgi:hypothetical protein
VAAGAALAGAVAIVLLGVGQTLAGALLAVLVTVLLVLVAWECGIGTAGALTGLAALEEAR